MCTPASRLDPLLRRSLAGLLLMSLPLSAQQTDGDVPVSREEHESLLREFEKMRRDLEALKRSGESPAPEEAPASDAAGGSEGAREEVVDDVGLPGFKGGLFDKPFLQRTTPQVYVGGYFDVEFRDARNQDHDFRFHRLIPFFYADIHERVKFASEIEIEDGSEVEVEFAFLDVLLLRQVNARGGVILDPLGKFNLIHDSPINDLTDRPLVNQFVIPTTLREVGAGLFGTLTPDDAVCEVKYELYLVTGFKGLNDDGTAAFSDSTGLRDGRASKDVLDTRHFGDNNNSFAGVGRLSVSPHLGTEIGVSAHTGDYDESGTNNLTVAAVDGLYTVPQFKLRDVPIGPIELQGEAAYAFVERNSLATLSGIPGDLWGYYVQCNYHLMPAFLTENAPVIFFPGSTFTFVVRWDQIDLDAHRRRRLTIGLNYRPVESAAIKFDYQFNRATGSAPRSAEDDALVISITSYF